MGTFPPSVKVSRAQPRKAEDMTTHDPSTAPRQRASGYKGDAWTVSLPPDGATPILALDSGADSVAIVRIPDGAWDRGDASPTVHVHDGYDESVVITSGSGMVLQGPDPDHIIASRFEAPVVVVFPVGAWHHIVMDPGVAALGTCFYTIPGTIIEPFTVQMEIVTRGRVTFADLPVVEPKPVAAAEWTTAPVVAPAAARFVGDPAPGADPLVRILPFPAPRDGDGLVLPLDTGHDSLFVMGGAPGPERAAGSAPAPLPPPEFVDVHRHPDVDEYIIRRAGAGYVLNGPSPEAVTLTPFRGPCVMVMPAGAFHRIVQTEEDPGDGSILIYADRGAVVERFETIMARTTFAELSGYRAPGRTR